MTEMDLFKVSDEEFDQEFLPEWPEEANEIIEPEEFVDYEEPEEYELESDLVIPGEEEDYIFEKGEKILVYSKKKVEEEKLEERVFSYKGVEYPIQTIQEFKDFLVMLKSDPPKALKIITYPFKGDSYSIVYLNRPRISMFPQYAMIMCQIAGSVLIEFKDIVNISFGVEGLNLDMKNVIRFSLSIIE